MGVDLHCLKQKEKLAWDLNISGSDLLGYFHFHFKLDHTDDDIIGKHHIKYRATKEDAYKTGQAISGLSDTDIESFYNNVNWENCFKRQFNSKQLFGGSSQEFVKWIREWQQFLLTCEGYEPL